MHAPCNLFPGEEKFTFICNSNHLAKTNIHKILKKLKPKANVIEIPKHKKGPVYAVSLIYNLIDDDEEAIVNYCDFGTYWDYKDFLRHTRSRNADGAVPAYKGFHPHMLGTTNYAFMRDNKQWMLEIKEKEPFTDNRMNEYASNGTYYFKKGTYLKKYFSKLIDNDINLGGEYYVSLVYNLLVNDGLNVSIYEIQHMLQWGTPQDLEEYKIWSNYFRNVIVNRNELEFVLPKSTMLIPLAGKGSRFADAGYKIPKPLLKVSGKPMIVQAANSLPKSESQVFVVLQEHLDNFSLKQFLLQEYPNAKIVPINKVTDGQAITCSFGLKGIDKNAPLLIGATDNGMIINKEKYNRLIRDKNVDAIIFTFRHHISSKNNPEMYGWVKADLLNNALSISVKKPISKNPYNDHAIVGTFWFRQVEFFNIALNKLIDDDIRINGEFYVDSLMGELIKIGFNVKVLEVDNYICWGTPNDYETFYYWQSFFHKAKWHPYSLEKDPTVNKSKIINLDKKFRKFEQKFE